MLTSTELALKADLYYETRELRLKMQREVDAVDKEEKKLKAEIINALKAQDTRAIGGKVVTLTLKQKDTAVAKDWAKLHAYIIENDAWDLMQKRLTQTAVDLRWADGIVVPGIEKFPVDELSYSKV
jgi:hypothetical protein